MNLTVCFGLAEDDAVELAEWCLPFPKMLTGSVVSEADVWKVLALLIVCVCTAPPKPEVT